MTIKLFFVILLLFGAVHVKSAFGESGLDLEEINPDQTAVGSAEEESEDGDEDTEPVLIDENQLDTDLDQYENETNVLEAESGEEVEETSDVLEDKGKTRFRRGFVSYELMIFLGTGRHPSDYKDYGCHCRRRLRKGPRGGKRPRYRRLRVMGKVDNCCRIRNICLGKLTKSKYCPFKKIGAPFDIPYLAGLTKSGGKKIFKCASFKYRSYDRCRKELCKCNTEAVNCFVRNKYRQKYAEIKPKMCRSRG